MRGYVQRHAHYDMMEGTTAKNKNENKKEEEERAGRDGNQSLTRTAVGGTGCWFARARATQTHAVAGAALVKLDHWMVTRRGFHGLHLVAFCK